MAEILHPRTKATSGLQPYPLVALEDGGHSSLRTVLLLLLDQITMGSTFAYVESVRSEEKRNDDEVVPDGT